MIPPADPLSLPPVDPRGGTLWLVSWYDRRGRVVSTVFRREKAARAYLELVESRGGSASLHRSRCTWETP